MRSTKYLHILPKLVFGSALSYIMDFAGLNPKGQHEILVTESALSADHDIHCNIQLNTVDIGYTQEAVTDWMLAGIRPDYIMLYDVDPTLLQYDKNRYRTIYMANDADLDIVMAAGAKLNLVKNTDMVEALDNAMVYKPYVCRARISKHFRRLSSEKMFIGIAAGNRYKFPYEMIAEFIELVDPEKYEIGITDLRLTGTSRFNSVITKAISDGRVPALFKYTLSTPAQLYSRSDVIVDIGGFRTAVEAGIFGIPITHKHKTAQNLMEEIDEMNESEAYLNERKEATRKFCQDHLLDVNLQRLESRMRELV